MTPIKKSIALIFKRLLTFSHAAWQCCLYGVAFLLMIAMSFWVLRDFQPAADFSLTNYSRLLSEKRYSAALVRSFSLAVRVGGLSVLCAFPVAYFLAFKTTRTVRNLILFALLVPFFSSFLIRMFAWQIWLSQKGILAWLLNTSIGSNRQISIVYTETAVILGLLSLVIPISTIFIYLSLSRIDPSLLAAARNLGASSLQILLRVTLPLSIAGPLIAFLYCFLIAFGDFVCSSILGGNQIPYLSVAIRDSIKINDWPMAAALGTILLSVALLLLLVIVAALKRDGRRFAQPPARN